MLRDVANDIGMHESTVSRVVTNKYMHTPQGVFEMKFFFHSGISSSYGESVSSVTIKQRIRKIIENEDARKPLSDSKIVSILQKEGLVLARRTIAKYREELKIPTSNQRKVLYLTVAPCDSNSPDGTWRSPRPCGGWSTSKLGKLDRVLNDGVVSAQVVLHAARSTGTSSRSRSHARGDHMLHGVGDTSAWEASFSDAHREDRRSRPQKVKGKWQERKRRATPAEVGRRRAAARRAGAGRGVEPPRRDRAGVALRR